MIIKKLILTNFRAYTKAEFEFKQGMNLLVGINGVGKTTVLDALRVCLSVILPYISESKSRKIGFETSDIKIGANFLQVSLDFIFLDNEYNLLIVKHEDEYITKLSSDFRDQTVETLNIERISPALIVSKNKLELQAKAPIGIHFSTKRSITTEKGVRKSQATAGAAAAYVEALKDDREFSLKIFSDWYKAQLALAEERSIVISNLAAITKSIELFLPGFNNLHIVKDESEEKEFLLIDKAGVPLSIHQLSDGERGVLSLVLDIAKRLVQANVLGIDPIHKGTGVVLIDEIDLHLHPKWQRTIVKNLTKTFPSIQFIATTHSPQIIGEVKPEFITVIDKEIARPAISYGVDSGRILEEILDTTQRNSEVNKLLQQVYKKIDDENYKDAKK